MNGCEYSSIECEHFCMTQTLNLTSNIHNVYNYAQRVIRELKGCNVELFILDDTVFLTDLNVR
jgi:hypothetical protein